MKLKKYAMFLAITCFMALIICGSATADQTVIPSSMDQNLTVSNDNGARYNANENVTGQNNTYITSSILQVRVKHRGRTPCT
jgi:hypothetical protein